MGGLLRPKGYLASAQAPGPRRAESRGRGARGLSRGKGIARKLGAETCLRGKQSRSSEKDREGKASPDRNVPRDPEGAKRAHRRQADKQMRWDPAPARKGRDAGAPQRGLRGAGGGGCAGRSLPGTGGRPGTALSRGAGTSGGGGSSPGGRAWQGWRGCGGRPGRLSARACLPAGRGLAAGPAGEGPAREEGRRLAARGRECGGPARCQVWTWGVRRERAEARVQALGEVTQSGTGGGGSGRVGWKSPEEEEGCLLEALLWGAGCFSLTSYPSPSRLPPLLFLQPPEFRQIFCKCSPRLPPHPGSARPSRSTRTSEVFAAASFFFVSLSLFLLGTPSSHPHVSPLRLLLTFQSQGHPGSLQQTWIQKVPALGSSDSITASPTPACKLSTLPLGRELGSGIRGQPGGRGSMQ